MIERGEEILAAALSQYPKEIKAIVERLAELINAGQIREPIDGGELYNLFKNWGSA